ncbi:FMNH2-utilizing oxygenase [Pseudoclavibacter endophyticus]|uniref:LLM class flavin-dependent oxidoreductase n=1 Tax=Pseudoclavibacter endophyticus TaxID=1778590 RepID=A0A6H9WM79_9MICO|nr:LLM class flavin-dependent oxidoreductase [Pseudoclavibacter endophyticus]KAB1646840.1 LLM class flavin-dependent oxidoreductase [Pseudoclavibacter endophyticus]GGA75106.1 FMNH2-utilizing oxygenase [Pseudoclavibacter endophyticus]
MPRKLTLGLALEGAGWHPSAWREPSARPDELFTPGYWVERVRDAEAAGADYVTIEDSLALQGASAHVSEARTDEVRGRLDALLIAARVAPATERIGLVPTVTTTHTEPFHVSKGIATLDFVSDGRAGWQPKLSINAAEAANFGRREWPELVFDRDDPALRAFVAELFDEADDAVEVVRRLWDSWEDDAEIRDVATDRFLDADKLHTIDFEGRFFSVRGPSITPRSPQGQPVVAVLAHQQRPYEFAASQADVVFTTPLDADSGTQVLRDVAAAAERVGRGERAGTPGAAGEALHVVADLVVLLDAAGASGADRLARLDSRGRALTSDARVVTGSAARVADEIAALAEAGYDGVRLRPGVLTDDVPAIGETLVPELRRRGLVPETPAGGSLRARFGLATDVPSRYARETAGAATTPTASTNA